jgi:hypothetical protein
MPERWQLALSSQELHALDVHVQEIRDLPGGQQVLRHATQ